MLSEVAIKNPIVARRNACKLSSMSAYLRHMKFMYLSICLALFQTITQAQSKKKVLFIGNSYTYVNNLPLITANMALSMGDTIQYDSSAPGGYTFQNHSTYAPTLTKIKSQTWDVVVLQAQSQEPSFPPAQVRSGTYPYAKLLVDSIRKYNPCASILFYMTWGRQNGDPGNCGSYTPLCTYDGMQARLRQSYMMFKDSFKMGVAPVGVAWKKIRTSNPTLNLYDPDESHPSLAGTYLAASVFYSSIFMRSTLSSTYTVGITTAEATAMRATASTTVLDSAALWNINYIAVVPQFTYTSMGNNTYSFQNTSRNALQYAWSFGSTQASPTHSFTGNPPFLVKLVAKNNCDTDSIQLTIGGTPTSIPASGKAANLRLYPNPVEDLLNIDSEEALIQVRIMNLLGEMITHQTFNRTTLSYHVPMKDLKAGIYLVYIETASGSSSHKILRR